MKFPAKLAHWPLAFLLTPVGAALAAENITFSDVPLFIASPVRPNLMVILDNSQSMDGTMPGMLVSGDNPDTRGNIARTVLRDLISKNRKKFNWGLTTFQTSNVSRQDTHAYYLGDENSMEFVDDCVTGVAAHASRKGCVEIPGTPPGSGNRKYVTFGKSGDDPSINDVLYWNLPPSQQVMFGEVVGTTTTYRVFGSRGDASQPWASAAFAGAPLGSNTVSFGETDAGFLPSGGNAPPDKRQVWIKRGWGYIGDIDGKGRVREAIQVDSSAHFDGLQDLLGNETDGNSGEIKNAAVFTPLAGTLKTVRDYFKGDLAGFATPITQSCQKNYVVLATDGIPTGKPTGTNNFYSIPERTNTKTDGTWTFGVAQQAVFNEISSLRNDVALAGPEGVKTYVIGMGDSVANESSVAALNRMANLGSGAEQAFVSNDATTLAKAFADIVKNVEADNRSSASVAVNSGAYNAGSAIFQAKFDPEPRWSGSLIAFASDTDGNINTAAPLWEAEKRLKLQSWNSGRKIITYKPSAALNSRGVAFRWPADPALPSDTEIDASQVAAIKAGDNDARGAARLAYLRGDDSKEQSVCSSCVEQFRDRPKGKDDDEGPLGDIVNSAPVYVAGPAFGYANDFEAKSYGTFASDKKSRTPVVYAGANDGMLHAFDAATGDELLAYVPAVVYSSLHQLSDPDYSHRYFVDGTPTVGDVFYDDDWHTLLVAGMRAGAKGLFALDVTNPALFSESTANAKSIVRWEFQDSADMGFVFGQPLLVKTNIQGEALGPWAVIVSGGYKSSGGKAVLFVIDAKTGSLIKRLDTGSGVNNGLSGPTAIDTNGDGLVDMVYAGDLNGNLWKFDLTSTSSASWVVGNGALPLYAAGATKPITSAPDVTRFPRGGFLVGFGTGRYLADGDNSTDSQQTIYAIWDKPLTAGTVPFESLQRQRFIEEKSTASGTFRLTSHAVGIPADTFISGFDNDDIDLVGYLNTKRGWYFNLPTSRERAVAEVAFRSGRLVVVSIIPSSGSCSAGGSGWLMEFDAITGNRLDVVTFDINKDNQLNAFLTKGAVVGDYVQFSASGESGSNVTGKKIDGILSGQTTVGKKGGIEDRLISTSDGKLDQTGSGRGRARDGRAMWREVR